MQRAQTLKIKYYDNRHTFLVLISHILENKSVNLQETFLVTFLVAFISATQANKLNIARLLVTTVRLRNCKNEIPKKVHQNILYDCPMIIN